MPSLMQAIAGRRGIVALAAAALLATACGSTVPAEVQGQMVTLASPGDDGLSVSGLPAGSTVNEKGQVLDAEGEVIGTVDEFGGTAAAPPGTTVKGGAPVAAPGEWGPGITDSKIYIGMTHADAGAANQAAFGTGISADARKPYNAMAEWVNARGGLLGRKIEMLYYEFKAEQDINQQAQAACSHWTEDNEIFFFFGADANGILRECAHKNGGVMPLPGGSSLPGDFVKYPNYFEISGLNFYRAGNVTVKGLDNEGYYKDAKLGIVLWDHPDYKAALQNGYLPELKRIGISLHTEPAYISPPQQLQDVAATSADINAAVLRFQSEGVTHVMILGGPTGVCAQGCIEILWFRRAEQQNYRPRYGLNANNIAIAGRDAGLYPEEQLDRMVSVEWSDDSDFYDEGWKKNEAREKCYAIMRSKDVPMRNVNEQGFARFACEQFWFVLASLGHLDGVLNAPAFTAAANQLQWSFQSPQAYAILINANQHDGTAAARNLMFGGGCDCFKWLSKPYRV
jgi:hypothetical protein